MKKLGIITHFYNSTNYGGVLQSYALCRYFDSRGVDCEQICYNSGIVERSFIRKVLSTAKRLIFAMNKAVHIKENRAIKKRKNAFISFRNAVPHSKYVYTFSNIKELDAHYSAFVTGSDQVWHPNLFGQCYSLLFTDKPKFSYAASMATNDIGDDVRKKYKIALDNYSMISVRERNAQRMLNFRSDIELVLDPVFLLSEKEWSQLASERLINERYCFTYFLGDSSTAREEVLKYAHLHGLKLVNIPFLNNSYRKCDKKYGDVVLSDIGPKEFLSLIMNAECVFTDSFHAICLSFIFHKDFYVFKRDSKNSMNSRITDILYTLELEGRYISEITSFESIDYTKVRKIFHDVEKSTFNYLDRMVEKIKEINND